MRLLFLINLVIAFNLVSTTSGQTVLYQSGEQIQAPLNPGIVQESQPGKNPHYFQPAPERIIPGDTLPPLRKDPKKDTQYPDYNERIGNALIVAERRLEECDRKDTIIRIQAEDIRTGEMREANLREKIMELAEELSRKPQIVLTHDWVTTGILSGIAAGIVTVLFIVLK